MDVKFIQKHLDRKFDHHKYQLQNSYIFDWESDFFSTLKNGMTQEFEIKLTHSDFLADFKKKNKHKALLQKFTSQEYRTQFIQRIYRLTYNRRGHETTYTVRRSNGSDERYWKKNNIEFLWVESEIDYVTDSLCPNKFSYICPPDVISKDEVPPYSGLYYIYPTGRIITKKRPPYIHKELQDLKQLLLDKFYYKHRYKK